MISPQAVEAYASFLERLESGESLEFEEFLAQHSRWGSDLERLHARRGRLYADSWFVAPKKERTARELLAARVALDPVLGRLAQRAGFARRYRHLGTIREGGMGRVLRVFDRDLRRVLAMKLLVSGKGSGRESPGFDALRAARLLEEAQITAQLDHPGIPSIHEVGLTPEGELYFTMKLIASERTLEDVIEELHAPSAQPEWSLPRVLALVQRACEAVAYAHERGVIHRDLKPANVLVGDLGEVYVGDWGVARALGPNRSTELVPRPDSGPRWVRSQRSDQKRATPGTPLGTLEGHTVGTPEYMSPEQARGELQELDARSDVYSMGALLQHVLTGKAPEPDWVRGDARGGSDRRGSNAPRIPAELEAICARAMAPSPAERYADMRALTRDLAAFLEGGVVQAYQTGAIAELGKWVRRNKGFAAASGLAAAALVAGLAISLRFLRSERLERARAETQLAIQTVDRGDKRAREHLLSIPESERNFEWRHLLARTDSSRLVFAGHSESIRRILVSPAGDPVISVSADGNWRTWSPYDGREQLPVLQETREELHAAALSPDGQWLATLGSAGLRVRSAGDGSLHPTFDSRQLPDGKNPRWSLAFAADGERLAVIGADQHIRVYQLGDGSCAGDWSSGGAERCLAWVGDDELASGGTDGRVKLWDASSGELRREWSVPGNAVRTAVESMAMHLPSGRLATGDLEGMIRVWSLQGEEKENLAGHGEAVLALAFDPEGLRIASGSSDRSVRLWDIGGDVPLAVWAGHGGPVLDVAFDPTGENVLSASADRTVRVWSADQEPGITSRKRAAYPLRSVRFSPDALRIAVGSGAFDLSLWDAERALPLATLRGHRDRIDAIQWTPDGRFVVTASADDTLALWDTLSCVRRRVFAEHSGDVTGVALDPRGERFVSSSVDGSLRLWSLEREEPSTVLHRDSYALQCVAWSPDGGRIAAGTVDGRLLHGAPNALRSYPVGGLPILRLAFATDGRLALAGDDGLRLWDARKERVARQWFPSVSIQGVAFSPDGSRLACAAYDAQVVHLCDPRQAEPRATFALTGQISDLAWAPDGGRLATVDMLGFLRIFETRSPQEFEVTRREARELASRMEPLLRPMFDEHLRLASVQAAVETLPGLDARERQEVKRQASVRGDDAATTAGEALEVLEIRAEAKDYLLARRKLEVAVELEPHSPRWKTLMGTAHARLDEHESALERIPDRGSLKDPLPRIRRIALALRTKSLAAVGRMPEAEEHAEALRRLVAAQANWARTELVAQLLEDVEQWLAEGSR